MARGVNKVILIGNLGADPETRYMQSGKPVTNFRIATSETWKDKESGEQQERTEWHSLVCYDKVAEIAEQYLKKGSQVYIEGKLQTRKWQDKEGKDRYTTEIVVAQLQMLGGRPEQSEPRREPTRQSRQSSARQSQSQQRLQGWGHGDQSDPDPDNGGDADAPWDDEIPY